MPWKDPEKKKEYDKRWQKTARGRLYRKKKRERWLKKKRSQRLLKRAYHRYNTSEKGRAARKRWRDRVRRECIEAYGGKCACCGEAHHEFLTAEHKKGGGHAHRKSINGINFWYWLRKMGFPKRDFELRCWNCNLARGLYGYCPHEREKQSGVGS